MTGRRYYLTTLAAFERHASRFSESHYVAAAEPAQDEPGGVARQQATAASATPIFALIDADEAAHLALEGDADFEPLPHPLARAPVSERVAAALAPFGVAPGDDTFTVAEKVSRAHPLLRHRVF
jgi:hypothetical protein